MKLKLKFCLLLILTVWLQLANPIKIIGITDPLAVPNNAFGIHIIDENDLVEAAELVNHPSGAYGYVTLVIRQDDHDLNKWQQIFDTMRELKLIPLLRLATQPDAEKWLKPTPESAASWASFLNRLNWVTKNRYIILFNEPNHANEWGGTISPQEYVDVVNAFYPALKAASPDFFILPAGFDLAADNSPGTLDAFLYYRWMHAHDPEIFTRFDGWATHSYPNPGFSGSPLDTTRRSIVGYRHERQELISLGLPDNLPLFITETGWIHSGNSSVGKTISPDLAAQHITTAIRSVWTDPNIVAITPFVLKYRTEPFSHFSWMDTNSNTPLPQYLMVKDLPKVAGQPVIERSFNLNPAAFPDELVVNSVYTLKLPIENTGQSIWDPNTDALTLSGPLFLDGDQTYRLSKVKPFQRSISSITFKTSEHPGEFPLVLQASYRNIPFGQKIEKTITLLPPPSVFVSAVFGFNRSGSAPNNQLLIYDGDTLIQKVDPFTIEAGNGFYPHVRDVIPGKVYRFVLVRPYYLPATVYTPVSPFQTTITFKRVLPLDADGNGRLNPRDIVETLKHPLRTLNLWFY